jgi:cell wall-associated NlpC family hydrolase
VLARVSLAARDGPGGLWGVPAIEAGAQVATRAAQPSWPASLGGSPSLLGTDVIPALPVGTGGAGVAAARDALGFLGVPYVWGGSGPAGFDCSGLVQYVFARHGVRLPRVAADQARVGIPVAREALLPGDVVFFADPSGYVHHEGIYLGEGRFVHAPHTGDVVKISSLEEPYYARELAGGRRY